MINLRRGFGRIGYVLLLVWEGIFVALIGYGLFFGKPDWSQWQFLLTFFVGYMVGVPLAVFLLWRALLWMLGGFTSPQAK